jgi:hypothetical protein
MSRKIYACRTPGRKTMALPLLPELLIFILVLLVVLLDLYIKSTRSFKNPLLPMDWPLVGILPSLVINLHRLHVYIAFDTLAPSGHSLKVGIASIRIFGTCYPTNIQHIFTSNRANYPKGEELADIFDVTKQSLFTIDGEMCRHDRANCQSVLSSPRLVSFTTKCCRVNDAVQDWRGVDEGGNPCGVAFWSPATAPEK